MQNRFFIANSLIFFLTAACVAAPYAAGDTPEPVYAIGAPAYAEAIAAGKPPMKMGRMAAGDVPETLPRSFLQQDGSYAGSTVYPTVTATEDAITRLVKAGALPAGIGWEVYLLQADWRKDVYQLNDREWHLRQNVPVTKRVAK